MTDVADWPFVDGSVDDADRHHRWVGQYRIPVVRTPYPRWKYEVALVICDDELIWPGIEPAEDEARIVGSYIDYRRSYYNASWAAKMLARPLDVDSSTNTVILLKRPDGCWCYRRMTWTSGYPLVPPAAHLVPDAPQYVELVKLLDRINEYSRNWPTWKANHPEVFGQAAA